MIRTTISKIKRVLYVSRILRGDNHTVGKFEQSYNGLRQASNKSTNSNSEDGESDLKLNETVPLKYGVSVVCEECVRSRPSSDVGAINNPSFQDTRAPLNKNKENEQNTPDTSPTLYKRTSSSKFEVREKILAEIFGDMNPEPESREEKDSLEPEILTGNPKSTENSGTMLKTETQQMKEDILEPNSIKKSPGITPSTILHQANAATNFYKCVSEQKRDERDKILIDIFGEEMCPQQEQSKVETDTSETKLTSDNLFLETTSPKDKEITNATESKATADSLILGTVSHQGNEITDVSESKLPSDNSSLGTTSLKAKETTNASESIPTSNSMLLDTTYQQEKEIKDTPDSRLISDNLLLETTTLKAKEATKAYESILTSDSLLLDTASQPEKEIADISESKLTSDLLDTTSLKYKETTNVSESTLPSDSILLDTTSQPEKEVMVTSESKLTSENVLLDTMSQQEKEIANTSEAKLTSDSILNSLSQKETAITDKPESIILDHLLLDNTSQQKKETTDTPETKLTLDNINHPFETHDTYNSIESSELKPECIKEQENYKLVKEDFINHLCHGVILMEADADRSKHVPPTLQSVVYNNLYDGDPEEMQDLIKSPGSQKEENQEPPTKHIEVDPYWSELYENNMVENCMYYEPQCPINPETLKIFRALRRQSNYDPREPVYNLPCYSNTEFMTTITEDEEILTQKLERIDETPVIEAERTKINESTPKVLGNKENVNFSGNTLDKMATGLMYSNKYDTSLNEIERASVYPKEQKSKNGDLQDVQAAPNKPRKPTPKKEKELEIPFVKKDHTTFSKQKYDTGLELSSATLYIQRTNTSNVTQAEANQSSEQRQAKCKPIDLRQTWAKKQLDPTHVLTCNETCAISPKSLLKDEMKIVEATDAHPILETKDKSRYDMSSAIRKSKTHAQNEYTKYCLSKQLFNTEPFFTTYRKIRNLPGRGKEESSNKVELNTIKAATSAMATGALTAEKTYPMEWPKQVFNASKDQDQTFSRVYLKNEPDITEECIVLDKIKRTSEQLQATSQQLLATEEKMQITTELLKDTTERLIATTEQLHSSTEKLIETTEKLNGKETEQTDQNQAVNYIAATSSDLCAMKSLSGNSKASTLKPSVIKRNNTRSKSKQPTKDGRSLDGLAQQGAAINPAADMTDDILASVDPIPDVNDKVRLSEVMRKVRERNKLLESCKNALAVPLPAEGKITKKPCTPHSQPMAPPTWTSPQYPQPARQFPKVCVPKKKSGKPKQMNCSVCDTGTLTIDRNLSSQMNDTEALICPKEAVIDLTEDFVTEIKTLGRILEQGVVEVLEGAVLAKSRRSKLYKAKDYEPWTPIPSWPYPKKEKKRKLQCPKDGCPYPPPSFPCLPGLPMGLKPCDSMPTFPKRSCSLIEFFTVTIGDHKVVDLGEF